MIAKLVRKNVQFLLGAFLMQVLHPSAATCLQTQAAQQDAPVAQAFASHDFDFLRRSPIVEHRKLKHRLTHSDEWEIFSGTCGMRMLLGDRKSTRLNSS